MNKDEAILTAQKYIKCRTSTEAFCRRMNCENCPNDYGEEDNMTEAVQILLEEAGCK